MRITAVIPLGAVALVVSAILTIIACKKQTHTPTQAIYLFAVRFFGLWYALTAVALLFKIVTIGYAIGVQEGQIRTNFVPLKTIIQYVGERNKVQILGNIAALLPFPILLYLNFPKMRFKKCVLISAVVTMLIEPLQLLMDVVIRTPYNSIDIDDLILNALGVAVGLVVVKLILSVKKRTV